jgi:hypothetical protein
MEENAAKLTPRFIHHHTSSSKIPEQTGSRAKVHQHLITHLATMLTGNILYHVRSKRSVGQGQSIACQKYWQCGAYMLYADLHQYREFCRTHNQYKTCLNVLEHSYTMLGRCMDSSIMLTATYGDYLCNRTDGAAMNKAILQCPPLASNYLYNAEDFSAHIAYQSKRNGLARNIVALYSSDWGRSHHLSYPPKLMEKIDPSVVSQSRPG